MAFGSISTSIQIWRPLLSHHQTRQQATHETQCQRAICAVHSKDPPPAAAMRPCNPIQQPSNADSHRHSGMATSREGSFTTSSRGSDAVSHHRLNT
ncbi:hypothetical protein ACLOJK_007515 [Asimina triloba]